LYQFPRKAPLPPATEHLSPHPPPPIPTSSSDLRPLSPQSLNSSSNISRSNTFNTISSNGSTTMRSRDLSPDPPSGFRSPRRMLSQKSQNTMESNEPMKNDHPEVITSLQKGYKID
jgi:hypothetical protein